MEKRLLTAVLLFITILSPISLAENPKQKDPFLNELLSQNQPEQECGEPQGDGLMFSCDVRNEAVIFVETGSSFTLNCSVSGSRNPSIFWKRNGHVILKGPEAPRRNLGRPFLRTDILYYTVGCATQRDAGVYVCVAQADGVTIRQKTNVFVITEDKDKEDASNKCGPPKAKEAPKIYANTETVFDAPDAIAQLSCRATGTPSPAITWYRRENDMSFTKIGANTKGYSISSNNDLLLPPLSLEPLHFAEYKCEAKNDAGEDSATSYIQVMPLAVQEEMTLLSPSRTELEDNQLLTDDGVFDDNDLLSLTKRIQNRRHPPIWDITSDGDEDTHEITESDLDGNARSSSSRLANILERLEKRL